MRTSKNEHSDVRKPVLSDSPEKFLIPFEQEKPLVVIVGRPNVGKSTFFNRLIRKNIAIVDDAPGTTRDRNRFCVLWEDKKFWIEDTGGYSDDKNDFSFLINQEVLKAIAGADLLVLMVDVKSGLLPQDQAVAHVLRKKSKNKKIIVIANKADNEKMSSNASEFLNLGFGEPQIISAMNGRGMEEFMDHLVAALEEDHVLGRKKIYVNEKENNKILKIAVVGRPNVGKSSLINTLTKEERMIVSPLPGTTRDAVDIHFAVAGKEVIIIDTMGLRKKKKISDNIELQGVSKTLKSIDKSDCVIFMIDAIEGVGEQEERIAGFIHQTGKCVVLIVNKLDLVQTSQTLKSEYQKAIFKKLFFVDYAAILFVSALTKKGIVQIFNKVVETVVSSEKRIESGKLNLIIKEMQSSQNLSNKGRSLKMYYITQSDIKPPSFVLFVNKKELFHFSYRRQLENRLREKFKFFGTPIKVFVKSSKR